MYPEFDEMHMCFEQVLLEMRRSKFKTSYSKSRMTGLHKVMSTPPSS